MGPQYLSAAIEPFAINFLTRHIFIAGKFPREKSSTKNVKIYSFALIDFK